MARGVHSSAGRPASAVVTVRSGNGRFVGAAATSPGASADGASLNHASIWDTSLPIVVVAPGHSGDLDWPLGGATSLLQPKRLLTPESFHFFLLPLKPLSLQFLTLAFETKQLLFFPFEFVSLAPKFFAFKTKFLFLLPPDALFISSAPLLLFFSLTLALPPASILFTLFLYTTLLTDLSECEHPFAFRLVNPKWTLRSRPAGRCGSSVN